MGLWPVDKVVAWHSDTRGRPTELEGARERRRLGPLTRFLLPGLDPDFASAGDLVRLWRLPIPGTPVVAMVNFTRGVAATVPPYRRLAAILPIWAAGLAADLHWALDGKGFIAGLLAALPALVGLRLVAHRAEAMTDEASAYKARIYWQLGRHWLPSGTKLRPEPAPEPPDWERRLAASYAHALPSHEWHSIAALALPGGRLSAADPYDIGRAGAIEVPPGTYEVEIAVGLFGPPSSGLAEARVTHAWVKLRQGAAVRWEPVRDSAGALLRVGVDSGLASFSASGSAPGLLAAFDDGSPYGFNAGLEERLEAAMRGGGRSAWAILDSGEARLVAFESGYGDGLYDVYRGLDEGGEAVAVAIDFKVADAIYFA